MIASPKNIIGVLENSTWGDISEFESQYEFWKSLIYSQPLLIYDLLRKQRGAILMKLETLTCFRYSWTADRKKNARQLYIIFIDSIHLDDFISRSKSIFLFSTVEKEFRNLISYLLNDYNYLSINIVEIHENKNWLNFLIFCDFLLSLLFNAKTEECQWHC